MQTVKEHLHDQLDPSHYPNMSAKMAAFVGYILDTPFTEPPIVALTVDWDSGVVMVEVEDGGGFEFFASVADVNKNWKSLLSYARLTSVELAIASLLYDQKLRINDASLALRN